MQRMLVHSDNRHAQTLCQYILPCLLLDMGSGNESPYSVRFTYMRILMRTMSELNIEYNLYTCTKSVTVKHIA